MVICLLFSLLLVYDHLFSLARLGSFHFFFFFFGATGV
jgi:hypothetical protein